MQTLLLTITKGHGSKKKALEKVQLGSDIWTPEVHKLFEDIKRLIADRVTLSHLDPDKQLCMNTDASDHYWAGVLTQIPLEDAAKPQAEQRHEPLAFISGDEPGAMSRWSILENEAFIMVYFMAQTDYYTACAGISS